MHGSKINELEVPALTLVMTSLADKFPMKYLTLLTLLVLASANLQANVCDPEMNSFVTKYGKFKDAVVLAKQRNYLLSSIRKWQKFMGQEVSQAQYHRARIESFLKFSLKHDRPVVVKEHFEAMSNEVQLAYHIIKKNDQLADELGTLLLKDPNNPDLINIKTQLGNVYAENLKQAKIIAKHIDEYSTVFTTLNKLSTGTDKVAENARFVLDKLQAQYILDNFFIKAKIPKKMQKTPKVSEVYSILDEFAEADIYLLKIKKRKEMVAALMSLSPTEALFKAMDRVLVKIPWVDKTKFRAFIAEANDIKLHAQFYPGIERVLMTEGAIPEKLQLLMNENVISKDDAFLMTFSRRIDAKDTWKKLKEEAAINEPDFLVRMNKAEEKGKKLSDLSQLKDDSMSKLMIRFLDFAVVSGTGALGYYFYFEDGVIKSKEVTDENKEKRVKEEQMEEELDQNLDVTGKVIDEMKKDNGEEVEIIENESPEHP